MGPRALTHEQFGAESGLELGVLSRLALLVWLAASGGSWPVGPGAALQLACVTFGLVECTRQNRLIEEDFAVHTEIINRGRGPEIAGTRITVYDIIDYRQNGWHHTAIAAQFRLSSDQVLAAIRYIEEHEEEVMAAYSKIMERINQGNPPEIEAKRQASHAKLLERLAQIQEKKRQESHDAGAVSRS